MITVEELFQLALRIIGVVLVYYGLQALLDAGLFQLGYFQFHESSPGYFLISGLFSTVLGVYLVSGAEAIVRFAYPETEEDEDDDKPNDDKGNSE
jgi:hypothetical protein